MSVLKGKKSTFREGFLGHCWVMHELLN